VEYHYEINADMMERGGVYLLLNGQLGFGLVELARIAQKRGLVIGKDVGIISYNESYLSEIILGGLTTVSTDFEQMGCLAANMVLSHNLHKVKCDFKLIRRNTF
jgi:DNA-binding LacI/PurR family transcriptional regulator